MATNKAHAALVAQRRGDALELRLAGVDLRTIGLKLAADPKVNLGGVAYPGGYGSKRYAKGRTANVESFKALVSTDLERALAERRDDAATSAGEYREVELARLDRLLAATWPHALRGDLQAMDRIYKGMDRRARLLGLDAPQKVAIQPDDAAIDAEIERLLGGLTGSTDHSLDNPQEGITR